MQVRTALSSDLAQPATQSVPNILGMKKQLQEEEEEKLQAASITRRTFSQFQSLKIRRSANFMLFKNIARRILKLQKCEKIRRELTKRALCLCVRVQNLQQPPNWHLFWTLAKKPCCFNRRRESRCKRNKSLFALSVIHKYFTFDRDQDAN